MPPTIEEVAGWLREATNKCEYGPGSKFPLWVDRAARVEAMGWRPIEVAPRDGTLIDLWDRVDGARIPDCKWVLGRFVYFEDHWEEWLECCDATHFMLLPAPPVNR